MLRIIDITSVCCLLTKSTWSCAVRNRVALTPVQEFINQSALAKDVPLAHQRPVGAHFEALENGTALEPDVFRTLAAPCLPPQHGSSSLS